MESAAWCNITIKIATARQPSSVRKCCEARSEETGPRSASLFSLAPARRMMSPFRFKAKGRYATARALSSKRGKVAHDHSHQRGVLGWRCGGPSSNGTSCDCSQTARGEYGQRRKQRHRIARECQKCGVNHVEIHHYDDHWPSWNRTVTGAPNANSGERQHDQRDGPDQERLGLCFHDVP